MATINTETSQFHAGLKGVLDAILVDLTALRATVAAVVVDITELDSTVDDLVTKMNSDGGITDDDYAAAGAMTASAPDALTTE